MKNKYIVKKGLSYNKAIKKCPKGYRMLEIWELVKLACENSKIIFEEGSPHLWFVSATKKDNGSVRRLYRYGSVWGADWDGYLGCADGGCRVVFVRELKEDSK